MPHKLPGDLARLAGRRPGGPIELHALEARLLLSDIHGTVWEDADGDGLWDAGESTLAGWTIFLDLNEDGVHDAGEPAQTSAADGTYSFTGLAGGVFRVVEEIPAGWQQRYPDAPGSLNTFTDILAGLPGLYECSVDFGDYDNDGDLDLAVLGYTGTESVTRIYRNDDMAFVDSEIVLPILRNGALAWGDYNADGWLDLVLTGEAASENTTAVYKNTAGVLVPAVTLTGVDNSAVDWGDYDADGDLDLVVAGYDGAQAVTTVYRNDSGTFVDAGAALRGLHRASADWGDYDGDGDLDLLISGRTTTNSLAYTRVYRNDGESFADLELDLPGVYYSAVAWGDYDGDGDLDFALAGSGNASNERIAALYRNDGAGAFTAVDAGFVGVGGAALAWDDYNQDGRLDLAVSGYAGDGQRITRVYRNEGGDTFHNASVGLMGVNGSSLSWDDIDADGYPDMALAGYSLSGAVSRVYRNIGLPGPHVVELLIGETASGVNFGNYQPAVLEGTMWHDLNGDGLQDPGEPGLSDWEFYLDVNNNAQFDTGEASGLTGAAGAFRFEDLLPGTYLLRQVAKSGWLGSAPAQGYREIALTSGQTYSDADFGAYQPSQIGGTVFHDLDGNGTLDAGDPGLAGWGVYLDSDGNGQYDVGEPHKTTDTYGAFAFLDLSPGTYAVGNQAEDGWDRSLPAGGFHTVQAESGGVHDGNDFGQYRGGSVSGVVYHDEDSSGAWEAGEAALAGWTVFLDADDNGQLDAGEPYAATDAQGIYSLSQVRPGAYTLRVDIQAGWSAVAPAGGAAAVQILSDQGLADMDFGARLPQPEITVHQGATEILTGQAAAVDFGSVTEGQSAQAPRLTFTVANVGDAVMTIGQVAVPAGYTLTASPTATLAIGETSTFTVRLEAEAPGAKAGQISIANNDSNENPFAFDVTGYVLGLPEIEVRQGPATITDGQAAAVDFGTIPRGSAAAELVFTVVNLGDTDLTVDPVALTANTGFEIVQQPAAAAPGLGSTTFTLRLPTDTRGTYGAHVSFTNGDADGDESPFDFDVTGTVANNAPRAGADSASGAEDTVLTTGDLLANDTDADGDPIALIGRTDPAHGTLTDNGDGTFDYQPQANFHGTDQFTYTLSDGQGGTDVGTVTLTVSPVSEAPRADAGADQILFDEDDDWRATVDLDGTGSTDDEGPPALAWFAGGVRIASGPTPRVVLGLGRHAITLVATDQEGLIDTDTVEVEIVRALSAPALAATAPGPGAQVGQGDLYTVQWTGTDPDARVDVWVLGPRGWQVVGQDLAAGAGQFAWDTSAAAPGDYRVMLRFEKNGSEILSASEGWLRVVEAIAMPAVVLIGPDPNVPIPVGQPVHLEWSGGDEGTTMDLWALGPGGWTPIAMNLPAQTTRHDWDTAALHPGRYRVVGQINRQGQWALCELPDWVQLLAPLA